MTKGKQNCLHSSTHTRQIPEEKPSANRGLFTAHSLITQKIHCGSTGSRWGNLFP